MTLGLLLTSLGLGLRHGIDWDHIAAIADLSSTAESRRRGFMLSFLYAIGHAVVVIMLGALAIAFGAALPDGVDVWMGRVVGLTLVALGAWVLIELIRKGRDFRLRSRWILVLGGTFAGLRRVRAVGSRRKLSIEHEHDHVHDSPDSAPHDQVQAHDHDHLQELAPLPEPVDELRSPELTSSVSRFGAARLALSDRFSAMGGSGHSHGVKHRHVHRHETELNETAPITGNGTAAGIGVLHGVGVESPTQIAVFVASTSIVGVGAGMALLLAWVVGLIIANSLLAVLAAYGLLGAERNFAIYATVAAFVGVASLAMGLLLLFGIDSVLPELLV
ncbi:MAG: hypothetical protein ACRBK7_19905 [Acidimicrobiales bacterium]